MKGNSGYAVFFYPQAIEALGEAIKPYLQEGEAGTHVACHEIDTGGAFIEMTLFAKTTDGQDVTLELMVPSSMVRMIVSSQQAGRFGFRPFVAETAEAADATDVPAAEPAQPAAPDAAPAAADTGDKAAEPPSAA